MGSRRRKQQDQHETAGWRLRLASRLRRLHVPGSASPSEEGERESVREGRRAKHEGRGMRSRNTDRKNILAFSLLSLDVFLLLQLLLLLRLTCSLNHRRGTTQHDPQGNQQQASHSEQREREERKQGKAKTKASASKECLLLRCCCVNV